ncbi:PH domain-containing protein [Streptomyces sp. NPDC005438]|uniref:PH domain-containing protein n=1 Tax=Streptomyces sp. NPDC005438 TaxID=3156880 RepID=UPI0033AB6DC0
MRRLLPDRPEGRRLHPLTPWRRGWAPLAAMVGVVVHNPEQLRTWAEHPGWALVVLAALAPLAGAYGFLSWWYTSYLVTDTELRIRTGLFNRRVAHIRLDRVQSIDVARPLLARLVGVAKLKMEVVGAQSKDELAFLSESEAVALRAELLARAAGISPEAASSAGEAPARELFRVDPRQLVLGSLLLGQGWILLLSTLLFSGLTFAMSDSVLATLAVLVPMLAGFWSAGVGRILTEYDWTLSASPDGIRIDRGLLDREHATVPPGRVQSIRLVEPLLWRPRGWVRVELRVAGQDEGHRVLIPVAPFDRAKALLGELLSTDVDAALESCTPAPERARLRMPIWWRGYGHGVTDREFVGRKGRVTRRVALVPHAKVQSVRWEQGPWLRRLGLAHVRVDDGAGGGAVALCRDAEEARALVSAQADRSRTGRHEALPDRWLT